MKGGFGFWKRALVWAVIVCLVFVITLGFVGGKFTDALGVSALIGIFAGLVLASSETTYGSQHGLRSVGGKDVKKGRRGPKTGREGA